MGVACTSGAGGVGGGGGGESAEWNGPVPMWKRNI